MSSRVNHIRFHGSTTNANAGAVGLAHKLRTLPVDELLDQQRAITDAARQCPELWPLASLRWTLLVAELAARKRMQVAS
jgi:hypothetical protein